MSRRIHSAAALLWGLILLAAGGLLLARNLGYPIPLWNGIARYWPAILIVWGLFKLIDYFRLRNSEIQRPLFSAGEVVLLILVILAGSAITIAANISPGIEDIFHVADIDIWDITGNRFEFTEHHEMDARSGSTIEIDNRFGSVDVSPAETDRITVDVKKTVIASDQAEAERIAKTFNFSILEETGAYRIVGSFDGPQNGKYSRRFRTSLTVHVPKHAAVKLDNRNGSVSLSGLVGNQSITNSFADSNVHDIEGNVSIQNRNGSVEVRTINGSAVVENSFADVDVRNITGALNLHNRNGRVEVIDIGGTTKIENRFADTSAKNIGGDLEIESRNGSLEIDSVKGMATVSTSYAGIRASNIDRQLRAKVQNGPVEVEHAGSDVNVETSYNNVSIRDAGGAITVMNRNGEVSVRLAKAPAKDITLTTQFSNIYLDLPAGSSFNMDARTRFGQVHSSFDGLSTTSNDRERSIMGHVGTGGPDVKLDTKNGDISVSRY